jgi:hypothetical protein
MTERQQGGSDKKSLFLVLSLSQKSWLILIDSEGKDWASAKAKPLVSNRGLHLTCSNDPHVRRMHFMTTNAIDYKIYYYITQANIEQDSDTCQGYSMTFNDESSCAYIAYRSCEWVLHKETNQPRQPKEATANVPNVHNQINQSRHQPTHSIHHAHHEKSSNNQQHHPSSTEDSNIANQTQHRRK